jgi:hypothetical protein
MEFVTFDHMDEGLEEAPVADVKPAAHLLLG